MRQYEPNQKPIRHALSERRRLHNYLIPSKDQIFYKFQAPNLNSLYTLSEEYFWFSLSHELNDPHELRVKVQEVATDEEIITWVNRVAANKEFELIGGEESYLNLRNNNYNNRDIELIRDYWMRSINCNLDSRDNGIKFFCASESMKSPTMWSHYTNQHTGWVIAFKPLELFTNCSADVWFKVHYEEEVPVFGLADMIDNMEWQHKLFATKCSEWQYEKEWRCAHNAEHQQVTLNKEAVAKIIFGIKCLESTEKLVMKLTENWNLEYLKAVVSEDKYEILTKPYEL